MLYNLEQPPHTHRKHYLKKKLEKKKTGEWTTKNTIRLVQIKSASVTWLGFSSMNDD